MNAPQLELSPADFDRIVAAVWQRIRDELANVPKRGVWMTVRQLREEMHFSTDDAARKWIRRRRIACVRRGGPDGRTVLIARADVERSLFERRRSR